MQPIPKLISALDAVPMISLEDCREHLRLTADDDSPPAHPDDDLVLSKLAAAREWCEGQTGLALTPRTLEIALDSFPTSEIILPGAPLVSITSVKYFDADGAEQTVATTDYTLDDYQHPGWLLPAFEVSWPSARSVVNAVKVRYVVGFNLWSDAVQTKPLPKSLRAAVLLLTAEWYENREESIVGHLVQEIPMGVVSLCNWHKIRRGMA